MKILFIAEATTGKAMQFYHANTLLYRTVKQAFEIQYHPFASDEAFLAFFLDKSCALEHLCVKTITKESAAKRTDARRRCIPSLAARIKKESPLVLIILMKTISEEVHEAVVLSGIQSVKMIRSTPYPALSERHRLDCIAGIRAALSEATAAGILSS